MANANMFWITWGGFFLKYCEYKASGANLDVVQNTFQQLEVQIRGAAI